MPLEEPPQSSGTITSASLALAMDAASVSPDSTAATKLAAPAPAPERETLSSTDASKGESMSESDGVAEPAAKKVKRSDRKAPE
jgi:hypothetical protein